MLNEFNARPEVTEARNKLKEAISNWLCEAKANKKRQSSVNDTDSSN